MKTTWTWSSWAVASIGAVAMACATQGPAGAGGPSGDAGAQGLQGEPGTAGAKGEKGEPGTSATGAKGAQGDKGAKGDPGDPGAAGTPGVAGPKGATGETGEAGAPGEPGQTGDKGDTGATGDKGEKGDKGDPGAAAMQTGTISGTVKSSVGTPIANAAIATVPVSLTTSTDASGNFMLSGVQIGAYSVVATKVGFSPFALANVGVAAGAVTNVSLALATDAKAAGSISGSVTSSGTVAPTPLAGVTVAIPSLQLTTQTAADGTFTFPEVPPGPVYLTAAAPSAKYLDTDTRDAVFVAPGTATAGVKLVLSSRPSDSAGYVGMNNATNGCAKCHADAATKHGSSAHQRSLTRIARDANGQAVSGAFSRMLNATLLTARTVMVPLQGTITTTATSAVVTGTGTAFATGTDCGTSVASSGGGCKLIAGDEIGYTPLGLGWTKLGTIASIDSDTQVTLTANAAYAPGVASLTGATKYGVKRLSRNGYAKMLPVDANDIVAPAWPGVKATNPNYDANDPCIYGDAAANTTCAAGGTTKYKDGQVNVYFCNLKDGVSVLNDEYAQKFGGAPHTCSDGAFYSGSGGGPAVPMVHIDVIYGGQGDKDGSGNAHLNMGVFKQRFQGRLSEIKAAANWTYTKGKDLDSLTLPIQFLESGDRVNGGFKMNGYHPTEQKFPGESWTQRTRTFSHACAGCHNTGLKLEWDEATVTLPFGRDGAPDNSPMAFSAIKSYSFVDENITCEQCHGPGSEHAAGGVNLGKAIINPRHMTAESERQLCGKCHAYDDATNAFPAQDYGFEFPWNSNFANKIGGGDFISGVYQIADFFDNWEERTVDDEALWDPVATGGKLYGQAHRQQYIMMAQSKHANNPYENLTCTACHDSHTQYKVTRQVTSSAGDAFRFVDANFRDNTLCLSCHAGYGPFAALTKDDVAEVHMAHGGTVSKNEKTLAPSSEGVNAANSAIVSAVGAHMFEKTKMIAAYNPLLESMPVGRCTSCHMPKLAKSGGYTTGTDGSALANKAIVEGDQASHVFDVVWPWQSAAMTRGGPTFQAGYYGQFYSSSNAKYDLYGYMPNSCSRCHATARAPSLACPDQSAIWPAFWPFSEHAFDPFWSACTVSSAVL